MKIQIDRSAKLMLLEALKNGYFDTSDISGPVKHLYSQMTDEELNIEIARLERIVDASKPPKAIMEKRAELKELLKQVEIYENTD